MSPTSATRFAQLSKTLEKPNSWLTGNKSPITALQHLVSPAEAQAASYFHCIIPSPEAINSECHINSDNVSARIFTAAWLRLAMAMEKEGAGTHRSDGRHLFPSVAQFLQPGESCREQGTLLLVCNAGR